MLSRLLPPFQSLQSLVYLFTDSHTCMFSRRIADFSAHVLISESCLVLETLLNQLLANFLSNFLVCYFLLNTNRNYISNFGVFSFFLKFIYGNLQIVFQIYYSDRLQRAVSLK